MKKILLLFTAAGLLSLTGCNNDDDVDNDTIAEVFEVDNVTFTSAGNYAVTIPLTPNIYTTDMVLVYRLSGTDNGNDVWEPIPTSYNFDDGTHLNYYFDFSIDKVVLYLQADFDPNLEPGFSQNQVFRIMIVPGYGSNFRTSANAMDQFKDYNAVIKKYGIKESDIKKLTLNK